jgi:hypothetical protein
MGLDMNLCGDKYSYEKNETVDGFPVSSTVLDMGYWRKHANLHGFIVDTFADGEDECQRIHLSADDLHNLITALENDALYNEPVTGFFFGRSYFPGEKDEYGSYKEQKNRDIHIFTRALNWLKHNDTKDGEYRSIYYQASW